MAEKVNCGACGGTGQVTCYECNGTGTAIGPDGRPANCVKTVTCTACGGTGKKDA
jgi:hypothetical protein